MNARRVLKVMLPLLVLVCAGAVVGIRWWLRAQEQADIADLLKVHPITHLGIIMDGNRRWARQQGLKPWIGNRHGVEPLKAAVGFCIKHGIPYLTVYAFSLENLKRSQEELDYLFSVLAPEVMEKEFAELGSHGVRVRFVGDREQFPVQLRDNMAKVEHDTAQNTRLVLTVLVCYGGQQEIVAAAQNVCADIIAHGEGAAACTKERFEEKLWSGGVPAPELIIRTGCASRLSNFLSYQSAYSELYFLDKYWPDVTEYDFAAAVRFFAKCKRTFGA